MSRLDSAQYTYTRYQQLARATTTDVERRNEEDKESFHSCWTFTRSHIHHPLLLSLSFLPWRYHSAAHTAALLTSSVSMAASRFPNRCSPFYPHSLSPPLVLPTPPSLFSSLSPISHGRCENVRLPERTRGPRGARQQGEERGRVEAGRAATALAARHCKLSLSPLSLSLSLSFSLSLTHRACSEAVCST